MTDINDRVRDCLWPDLRTLVEHAPVFPSFAFRFDSEQGSVVFSGDTGPCRNLVRLARNADVQVIDAPGWTRCSRRRWMRRRRP